LQYANKHTAILWTLLGLLFAAICIVALYKTWPILFPDMAFKAAADPGCDLRVGACVTRLDEGASVTFSIEPKEIPVVKPLHLKVNLAGIRANGVEVDFSGVDMNMGFNRTRLNRDGVGIFSGQAILPVCVWDAMEWEAQILLETNQGLISVPYHFVTVRPGLPLPGTSASE
jgi:hypothetical protein